MYNGGEKAYKQEEWGNEIIFEKTIYEKSGHLLIKGASGKEVRNTQDLKDRYLQRFPCTTYVIPDEMWEGKRVEKY